MSFVRTRGFQQRELREVRPDMSTFVALSVRKRMGRRKVFPGPRVCFPAKASYQAWALPLRLPVP
jgi:hypothetical protein